MRILAIDTTTEACSAALYQEGEVIERFEMAQRAHSKQVLAMVRELLAEGEQVLERLDAIAFARGPGSFTGLRICAGVAQGLAFAADLPVVAVSTLAALAQGQQRLLGAERVLSAIDARMNEVYWGAYALTEGEMRPLVEECVCAAEAVPLPAAGDYVCTGTGWQGYDQELRARLSAFQLTTATEHFPHARDVASLAVAAWHRGEHQSAEQAIPVYLRDQVVQAPKNP